MVAIRIAVIGLGKIARDQHLPAIAASEDFQLTATVDPGIAGLPHVPHFGDLTALLADGPKVDAVALCMPPRFRYDIAAAALEHGLHVLLEKPPCATVAEAESLLARANLQHTTLFAAWHSRFAAGVEPAHQWLAERRIIKVTAIWHEDVRVWHPGQAWIWEKGGFGVFDPGINALSILTRILPRPFQLKSGIISTPANKNAPIAAKLVFHDAANVEIVLDLDWLKPGPPRWDIEVETDLGVLKLADGGAHILLPKGEYRGDGAEYPGLYDHFARLIEAQASGVDLDPLMHVMDAFEIAEQKIVEPFED